jgi:hypothetical protein
MHMRDESELGVGARQQQDMFCTVCQRGLFANCVSPASSTEPYWSNRQGRIPSSCFISGGLQPQPLKKPQFTLKQLLWLWLVRPGGW